MSGLRLKRKLYVVVHSEGHCYMSRESRTTAKECLKDLVDFVTKARAMRASRVGKVGK
jgi:hypothetical protein